MKKLLFTPFIFIFATFSFLTVESNPLLFIIFQFCLLFAIFLGSNSLISSLININIGFIPWSWYNFFEIGLRLNIYSISCIVLFLVLISNIDINKNYQSKLIKWISYLFLISIFSIFLSILFSANYAYSITTLLAMLPCFFPFLYYLSNFNDQNNNRETLIKIGTIQPVIGITVVLSMVFQISGLMDAGRTFIRVGRFSVSSLFFDFTTISSYFLFILITITILNSIGQKISLKYKSIYFITIISSIIGLILSGSRSGFLGIGAAFVFYITFSFFKLSFKKIFYLLSFSLFLIPLVILISYTRTDFLDLFSDTERIENWTTWLSLFRNTTIDNIVFGFGPGYEYFFSHVVYFSPHNLFLEAILFGGIIFLGFVLIQILTVYFSRIPLLAKSVFSGYLMITMVAPSVFETRVFASAGLLMSILLAYFHSNEKKLI